VLCVLSDILHAVDHGDVAVLVLLDLSAAFDMLDLLDHDILMQRVHSAFTTSLNDGSNRICQARRSTYVMDLDLTSHPLVCYTPDVWRPARFCTGSDTFRPAHPSFHLVN